MHVTEQWILDNAPDPETAENARALSDGGCFAAREKTWDGLVCWAECAGSAPNPYYVSADWTLSSDDPVFSCSCSERKAPCKHVLGLLYEILADKPFSVAETPLYVEKVRAKQKTERSRAQARLERVRRHDAAMREKKLERQLEGLKKAEKLTDSMLAQGLGRDLSGVPAQTVERLTVELGNCALPGVRDTMGRVAILERRVRQEGADAEECRAELLRTLAAQRVMLREARTYLDGQLAAGRYAMEEPVLYELLGGEWNSDELRALGSYRKNARLVQLSFDVSYDETRRAQIERGFWLELGRGDLVQTRNERSSKPFEGGASDDSCFSLLEAPVLYETPGVSCPRVWWDEDTERDLTAEERAALLACAAPLIEEVVNAAAEQIREPLLPDVVPALIRVGAIGRVGGILVLEDESGGRIALRDRSEDGRDRASTIRLAVLKPRASAGDALFGLVFYDAQEQEYCLHPYSLVRADEIIRLQF